MKMSVFIIPVLSLLLAACERPDRPATPKPPQATMNDQDLTSDTDTRGDTALTPFDQSENRADIAVTQKIRQSLFSDGNLSTNAKNIKIITINGVVTLRGVVANKREREIIANRINSIPGVRRIDNQLEVIRSNY